MTLIAKDGKRLSNKWLSVRYEGLIDKQSLFTFIDNSLINLKGEKKAPIDRCVIVHYDNCTHGYFEFIKKYDTSSNSKFDYNGIPRPTVHAFGNEKDFLRLSLELCKKDTLPFKYGDLEEVTPSIVDCIQSMSVNDAIQTFAGGEGGPLQFANQVIALHGLPKQFELTTKLTEDMLRPWQRLVVQIALGIVNDRDVHWIFDAVGKSGKSQMCKYLKCLLGKDVYLITQFNGSSNAATIIEGALLSGWTGKVMILDIARGAHDKKIFEPIECVKNGYITATKYKGGTISWGDTTVMIFSNFLPYTGEDTLSRDRWKIYYMNNETYDMELKDLREVERDKKALDKQLKWLKDNEAAYEDFDDDLLLKLKRFTVEIAKEQNSRKEGSRRVHIVSDNAVRDSLELSKPCKKYPKTKEQLERAAIPDIPVVEYGTISI